MAEKITLKNMLANLPQKTDVDTVVGRDSSWRNSCPLPRLIRTD